MTTCDKCKHWDTRHDLGKYGFGLCGARTEHRQAISTSGANVCRLNRFQPADPKVIRIREQKGGVLL